MQRTLTATQTAAANHNVSRSLCAICSCLGELALRVPYHCQVRIRPQVAMNVGTLRPTLSVPVAAISNAERLTSPRTYTIGACRRIDQYCSSISARPERVVRFTPGYFCLKFLNMVRISLSRSDAVVTQPTTAVTGTMISRWRTQGKASIQTERVSGTLHEPCPRFPKVQQEVESPWASTAAATSNAGPISDANAH